MNKELIDKYSKISIIVIAVILLVSFIWVVYFEVFVPYQERLTQWKQDQKYFETSKKRQENQVLLNKCYADIEVSYHQRTIENCTPKPDDSTYFYCNFDADFLKSLEIERTERKNCEQKYPLNF